MKKIGFVTPWFGEKIPGGAEMALRELAQHLHIAGVELEILTTCVEKFSSDWNKQFHKSGKTIENGLIVRRFSVRKRDVLKFDSVNFKLINNIPIDKNEEKIYIQEMINSPDLYAYLNKHQQDYSIFIFIPYMFGTTYFGIKQCPDKSVLIPCLHNESYAYLSIFKELFSELRGMIFLAYPEETLANKIYNMCNVNSAVLGLGVNTNISGEPTAFRKKYSISSPFILYAGRKDIGKNIDTLIKYFSKYKERNHNDIKLVMIGGGDISIPIEQKENILDLGFVSVEDKYNAFSASMVLCQPSQNESFSIVIMESWICGRPVLVNSKCEVTKDFAIRSNAGLFFDNFYDFEGVLNYIFEHPEQTDQMGQLGHKFVVENFSWDIVVEKYINYFRQVCKE